MERPARRFSCYVSLGLRVGLCGLSIGCVPATSYSAAVTHPGEVSVTDAKSNVVLDAGHAPKTRVVREERLPLGFGSVVETVERREDASVSTTVAGCPETNDNVRVSLVSRSGDLVKTEDPPVVSIARGKLVWTYGEGRPGSVSTTASFCRFEGKLSTDLANVRWVRRTTAGRTASGVLAAVVGSIITAGGGVVLAAGVNSDIPPVTATGGTLVAVGLLALGLGTYHLTLSPRSETTFPSRD